MHNELIFFTKRTETKKVKGNLRNRCKSNSDLTLCFMNSVLNNRRRK